MLPWVFFVVGYAQGSAQIGGEVKRASRSQYFAMVGGVLINGAVLAFIVWAYQHAVGHDWAASLSYLSNTGSTKLALPGGVPAGINLIASLLTGSVPLLLIIGVGFILWALMGTPLSTLQATRYMLAWSLDRAVPRAARRGERQLPHADQGDPAVRGHRRDRAVRARADPAGKPARRAARADRSRSSW